MGLNGLFPVLPCLKLYGTGVGWGSGWAGVWCGVVWCGVVGVLKEEVIVVDY